MATNFLNYTAHGVVELSDVRATECGHIDNLRAAEDIDNGSFVSLGAYEGGENIDVWAAAKPDKTKPVFLVATSPEIYEDYTTRMKEESNFYNAKGDVMRCYALEANDLFALSAAAFASGAKPAVGKYLSIGTDYKIGIADAVVDGQTSQAVIYDTALNGNYRIRVIKNA